MKLAAHRPALRFSFLASALFLSAPCWAAPKDLSNRFGLGIANLGPAQIPSVSVDWQATRATSFEFNLGLNTSEDANLLSLNLRYSRNLYIEEQQVYFLYLGGGLLSQQISGQNRSGYSLESGGGARFFLSGLPNLGISFRGGVELRSAGGVTFRSAAHFGVHYYF